MDPDSAEMWNRLYGSDVYAFGMEVNHYLKEKLSGLTPGRVLLPGEGEGRNAVYCALQGWEVFAFDLSRTGKRKADRLARLRDVQIDYRVGDVMDMDYPLNYFDALVLVFAHFIPEKRRLYHKWLGSYLKEGGVLILEGFVRPEGFPSDIRYHPEEIREDFNGFEFREFQVKTENLSEGVVIRGAAEVLQVYGEK